MDSVGGLMWTEAVMEAAGLGAVLGCIIALVRAALGI